MGCVGVGWGGAIRCGVVWSGKQSCVAVWNSVLQCCVPGMIVFDMQRKDPAVNRANRDSRNSSLAVHEKQSTGS